MNMIMLCLVFVPVRVKSRSNILFKLDDTRRDTVLTDPERSRTDWFCYGCSWFAMILFLFVGFFHLFLSKVLWGAVRVMSFVVQQSTRGGSGLLWGLHLSVSRLVPGTGEQFSRVVLC